MALHVLVRLAEASGGLLLVRVCFAIADALRRSRRAPRIARRADVDRKFAKLKF